MKRVLFGGVSVVAAGAVVVACAMPWVQQQAPVPGTSQIPAQPTPKPVSVEGTIQPLFHSKLSFQTAGRLRSVPVESGQMVKNGDIIAQLETTELELALQATQDELVLARAQEIQARDGALAEQVAAGSAGISAARTRLDEVMAGPREAERRAADAAVEQAAARWQDAVTKQEQLATQPKAADVEAAHSALEKAERDTESAAARLSQLERGGTAEEITQANAGVTRAQAELAGAQASLSQLLAGPMTADVAASQATLDQARTRLAQLLDAPRATPQDLANAQLAVDQARAGLDKARADASDSNLVGAGKPLSRQAADAAVRAAEIQVQQAQNSLDKLKASGPSEWDVRLAQQVVASAQASYDRVTRPPTPPEVARAEASVAGAAAALESAQARLTQVEKGGTEADLVASRGAVAAAQAGVVAARARLAQVIAGPTQEEKKAAAAAVEAAVRDIRSAEARRDQLLSGATRAEQEQARSSLAAAVASDAQTRRGATDASLLVAAARTRRAETAVEQARATLDRATLRAPFSGTVTSVSVREGETATAGTVAITVADLSRLQIETRDLDESAVARVKEGQEVSVVVAPLGRAIMPGRVLRVGRQPQPVTGTSSDVYYTATIALPNPHPDLRWGMTVRVEFR